MSAGETLARIQAMDEQYRQRTGHIGGHLKKRVANKGCTCWWGGCDDEAYANGLCSKHNQQIRGGRIFRPALDHLDKPALMDFARRFCAAAAAAGVRPEELIAAAMVSAIEMAEGKGGSGCNSS